MKQKKTAWYLDDDVLLEGYVIKNCFYPYTEQCGFHSQNFTPDMIDKEIFFDPATALSVCGDVPVIKKEEYVIVRDDSILAVNRGKALNVSNSIVCRDHTIDLEICAQNFAGTHGEEWSDCVGEFDPYDRFVIFYTSGRKTKIVFKRRFTSQSLFSRGAPQLLVGERTKRFNLFLSYLSETKYSLMER